MSKLRDRDEAIAVEELRRTRARCSNCDATDFFKAKGLIDTSPEAIRDWELDQGRRIMERYRRRCRRLKEMENEPINIRATDGLGKTFNYWCAFGDLSPDEGVQLIQECVSRVNRHSFHLYRYYDGLREKHGESFTGRFTFMLPSRPPEGTADDEPCDDED